MTTALDLPTISVLMSAAARCGVDLNPLLAELAIVPTADAAPFSSMPLADIETLLGALEQQTRQGYIPFAFAEAFNFEGQPAVSAYLASAPRLRDVGPLLDWIPQLIHPAIHFDGLDDGRRATLEVHLSDPSGRPYHSAPLSEVILAVVHRIMQRVAPSMAVARLVEFMHQPRVESALYEQHFGCEVRFGAVLNQLTVSSSFLDSLLPGSLPAAHAQAEETIRTKLIGDGVAPPLSVQVDDQLRANWQLFELGVEGLAQALKMHPRKLQRQLKRQGLSYSELLAKTRHDLASQMLRESSLDIESIGYKLGFKERRSFTNAFKSWQGQSPSEYRRQIGKN